MPSHASAVACIVCAAVLWSIGGVLIQYVDWHPLLIAGTRSGIAAVVIWAFSPRLKFTRSPHLWGGALAYAATVTLFVFANKLTSAANAIVLQYTCPVWVALLASWFLGERTKPADWLALGAVACGVLVFFSESLHSGGLTGDLLALASGVSFAWLALFMRRQRDGARIETVFAGNVLTALIAAAAWPFIDVPLPGLPGWTALVVLGVFQLGFTYILYARALARLTALEATLYPVLEPILNPVWVLLFLGTAIPRTSLIGGAIVLAAVTLRAAWSIRAQGRPVESAVPD